MKNIAADIVDTMHKVVARPDLSVVMLVATDVSAYGMSYRLSRRTLMSRLTIVIMLIVLSAMLLSSHRATAFTLRFGPVATAPPTGPGSEDADIPTPQLFRVAVDSRGVMLGTMAPADGYGAPEPTLRLHKRTVVSGTETAGTTPQASPHGEEPPTARRLSGAELLLLRKTRVVADHRTD